MSLEEVITIIIMETEIWKDVIWYEWFYQVSNNGNVKSLDRLSKTYWTRINHLKWNEIKQWLYKNWYKYVDLYKNWIKIKYTVHRLVWETFLEKDILRNQINHKDWNRENNSLDNLEYCTPSENHLHKFRVLWYKSHLMKRIDQLDLEWNFIRTWECARYAARELNLSASHIWRCCNKQNKKSQWFKWRFST